MAIRLLVNVPPHVAGSVVQAGALDEAFVQELLDSGQAVEDRSDAGPADPADVALCEVFELEDQIDAAISRRARVVMLVDGLDGGSGQGQCGLDHGQSRPAGAVRPRRTADVGRRCRDGSGFG